ncbi:MAG: V/A-type H+-transporting ATPase subunit I [Candidatus Methanocomedens sp.]|nr:MAG: V/A-type H+-transporting ATPase subunit I [ANME-2 cluster archaeon]
MLKPKKVSRALVLGNKKLIDQAVETLHDLSCVHIEDFTEETDFLSIGKPADVASDASNKLIKLRSLSNFLKVKPKYSDNLLNEESLLNEFDAKLDEMESAVSGLLDRRSVLESEGKNIDTYINDLQPLSTFPLDVEFYSGYKSISVRAGYIRGSPTEIETDIKNITTHCDLLFTAYNKANVVALFSPVEHTSAINEILDKYSFSELHIPELTGEPGKLLAGFNNRKEDIQAELESLENEITNLQSKYSDFVLASDEMLSITTQKAEAPLRFAISENTFIIDCWITDDQFDNAVQVIEERFNGSVFLTKLDIEKEEIKTETIPVEYDNPELVKPLETIMNLYSRPIYKEIDPTAIIFITFPLFYGLMLGDIGYGLVLLTLGLIGKAKLRSEGLKPLATLLIYCSISTLIFGILFAEIFGFHLFGHHSVVAELIGEHTALGEIFYNFHALPILDRLNEVPTLLIVTALIGVLHLNLGYLIGFRNEAVKHGIKTAILGKISWIILQIGVIIYAAASMEYLPAYSAIIGAAVAVLAVVMLIAGEGGTAILELPSMLTNILSYTRLAAIGLSSVGIALAINKIAVETLFPEGGLFIILGIIVLILGHTLNTVLGVVAPGLHSLRLQYVEFFTKFYSGGGREFNPFGYIRKYTEEK